MAMVAHKKIQVWISNSDRKESMCQNCMVYAYGTRRGYYGMASNPNDIELLGQVK